MFFHGLLIEFFEFQKRYSLKTEQAFRMTRQEKRALMLLKSLIFHYHGLDEDEKALLEESANQFDAHRELDWANAFIAEDFLSAFERAREFLNTGKI